MNFFKSFLHFFITITTGIVFICTVDTCLGSYDTIPKQILPQILASGAATAFVTVLIFTREPKTKRGFYLLTAVHYVLLCAIMVTAGIWFGWIDPMPLDMAIMCVYVMIVYAVVYLISYLLLKKEADEFNEAIARNRQDRANQEE